MRCLVILFAVLACTHAIKAPVIGNSTAQIKLDGGGVNYQELLKKQIHEECMVHCKPEGATCSQCEVDSHCVSECEVEMFRCHDHNRTTVAGKPQYDACTEKAEDEARALANPSKKKAPAAAAPAAAKFLLNNVTSTSYEVGYISKIEQARVKGICKDACAKSGDSVDSSCVPQCQVDIYNCMDANRKTEEGKKQYEECEERTIEKYENFQNPR
eukprot:gnl/TRDRNA2_/TRDRNA2_154511_c0_seq3.p1 gnl/TRDRNA2_/TRDRNA2_154511_c0~~gnl/TRDRNA2_/TRDRNA2_154511_c0_seq3.p1  ORF type:complete len:214 (-),score=51.48 gnl/TRDRNA2_/TRDRNA2_154511_c0_seq3:107-748(-)